MRHIITKLERNAYGPCELHPGKNPPLATHMVLENGKVTGVLCKTEAEKYAYACGARLITTPTKDTTE